MTKRQPTFSVSGSHFNFSFLWFKYLYFEIVSMALAIINNSDSQRFTHNALLVYNCVLLWCLNYVVVRTHHTYTLDDGHMIFTMPFSLCVKRTRTKYVPSAMYYYVCVWVIWLWPDGFKHRRIQYQFIAYSYLVGLLADEHSWAQFKKEVRKSASPFLALALLSSPKTRLCLYHFIMGI